MPIANGSLVKMKSGKGVGVVIETIKVRDTQTEVVVMWDGESFPCRIDVQELREATTDSPVVHKSMN
jgi:hypothetical protein